MRWRAQAAAGLWLAIVFTPAVNHSRSGSYILNNHSRGDAPDATQGADTRLRHEMRVAEDARPITRAEAEPLLKGLGHPSPEIARLAVRAFGRLERLEFLGDVRRLLTDGDPLVRAEAANAAAQIAGAHPEGAPGVLETLRARLDADHHRVARAALLDALGRLTFGADDARAGVARILAGALADEFSPVGVRLGAARGLEMLLRRARGASYAPRPETLAALRAAARGTPRPASAGDEARVRRVSVMALNATGAIDATYLRLVLDRDDQVRRLAIVGVAGGVATEHREAVVAAGLRDASPLVRFEALRVHGRHLAATDCSPEIAAIDDPDPHVALLAIDLLGTACPASAAATETLAASVSEQASWVFRSRALVAFARRAPERARSRVGRFAADDTWQARAYAAGAAAILRDVATLTALAGDPHPNVRAAAIDGLRETAAHAADSTYLAALAAPDYPVVLAAAKALDGTPARAEATAALLRALGTLTAAKRDTSRDPRLAILDRLHQVGDATRAGDLAPYTADFDPRVAVRAAEVLTAWTGDASEIRTTRLKTLPAPPAEELDSLPPGLRVTMAGGGTFDIRLFAADAPFAVWRIVRLVKQGYYDGLTYHRILPGFIIQGGSPGADEFVGDGPFMRDELGQRSHDRGTLGVSTRGRDTGDAQWFINLVDNPRLDHEYTIFGEIVAGMDVVDGIVEGDVMARVELLPLPAPGTPPQGRR